MQLPLFKRERMALLSYAGTEPITAHKYRLSISTHKNRQRETDRLSISTQKHMVLLSYARKEPVLQSYARKDHITARKYRLSASTYRTGCARLTG